MEAVMHSKTLVTFFFSAIVFFILYKPYIHYPPETIGAAIFKAFPIWSLAVYVLPPNADVSRLTIGQRNVIIGLLLSSIGDMCLIWRDTLFTACLFFFSLAHLVNLQAFYHYIRSSKSDRESWSLPMFLVLAVISWMAIHDKVEDVSMQYVLIAYSSLLIAVSWAATMHFEYERSWKSLAGCLGTASFLLSDAQVAVDRWITPSPFAEGLILITYYLAQLGITISAL